MQSTSLCYVQLDHQSKDQPFVLLSDSFLIRNRVDKKNLRKFKQGYLFCFQIQYLTLENKNNQINFKLLNY